MEFCSSTCKGKKEYFDKLSRTSTAVQKQKSMLKCNILYVCEECGQESSSKKYCSTDCRKSGLNKKGREKTLKKSAQTFTKEKPKPKYSFEALNRMAEWKRLNDDETWLNRFNGERL